MERYVRTFLLLALVGTADVAPALKNVAPALKPASAAPYTILLGLAQDGGYPQAGCNRPDCEAAWTDQRLRRRVASLGIVDPVSNQRWMIDATPDFPEQLRMLQGPLTGVLLTHAHIGHYLGLAHLGREVMGARGVPVYAMR